MCIHSVYVDSLRSLYLYSVSLTRWRKGSYRLFCICSSEVAIFYSSLHPYFHRCPGIAQMGFSPTALSMPWVEQDALAQDELHHAATMFLLAGVLQPCGSSMSLSDGAASWLLLRRCWCSWDENLHWSPGLHPGMFLVGPGITEMVLRNSPLRSDLSMVHRAVQRRTEW